MGRVIRRALVGAAVIALLAAGTVSADRIYGDADVLTAGQQGSFDLGDVAPGTTLTVPLDFQLRCGTTNTNHVDHGQTAAVAVDVVSSPGGGTASAEPATIGPVPDTWPADGDWCSGQPPLVGSTRATLVAPSATGFYTYTLSFSATLAPTGHEDGNALTGSTFASFTLTVVPNTLPDLTLPSDTTVEGNATGGATVSFSATATDAEDDPDPPAVCTPASGAFFPLGATVVTCSATDTAGAVVGGSFVVTVVDTTTPSLEGVPADMSLVAPDSSGSVATYALPTAADIVDPAPAVACAPAPGSVFPVGVTTVGCTATDASGNGAAASFSISVASPPPPPPPPPPTPTASVTFDPPVGPDESLRVNGQRVVPVKARVLMSGTELRAGAAALAITPCDASRSMNPAVQVPMAWQHGTDRWMALISTALLPAGCFRVELELTGATGAAATSGASSTSAGGFTLWVDPAPARGSRAR